MLKTCYDSYADEDKIINPIKDYHSHQILSTYKKGEQETMENNKAVKLAARGAGVPLWKVARELGISEATMTRRLREPLTAEEAEKFLKAIEAVREGA